MLATKQPKFTFIFCAAICNALASNGILSLIFLIRYLERIGHQCFISPIVREYPDEELLFTLDTSANSFFARTNWAGPHRSITGWAEWHNHLSKVAEAFGLKIILDPKILIQNGALVVYPERIIDNPLNAPKVIRYFGNRDGNLNGGKRVNQGPDDFILAHSRFVHPSARAYIFFPYIDEAFGESPIPWSSRALNVAYIGKGELYSKVVIPKNTVLITRKDPCSKSELAQLLKNSRFLFTFDSLTNLISESIFCGAIPVYMQFQPFSESEIDDIEVGPIPRANFADLIVEADGNYQFSDPSLRTPILDQMTRFRASFHEFQNSYGNSIQGFVDKIVAHWKL